LYWLQGTSVCRNMSWYIIYTSQWFVLLQLWSYLRYAIQTKAHNKVKWLIFFMYYRVQVILYSLSSLTVDSQIVESVRYRRMSAPSRSTYRLSCPGVVGIWNLSSFQFVALTPVVFCTVGLCPDIFRTVGFCPVRFCPGYLGYIADSFRKYLTNIGVCMCGGCVFVCRFWTWKIAVHWCTHCVIWASMLSIWYILYDSV